MIEIKAPTRYFKDKPAVFLCGSIEMGAAENWQTKVSKALSEFDIYIFNPRRDDWDSSWVQSITNPQFKEQVEWELKAQEDSDAIIVYFDPKTKSPITLLELGLFKDKPMAVCCPQGYFRRGNVEIVCKKYGIRFYEDLDGMISDIQVKFRDALK